MNILCAFFLHIYFGTPEVVLTDVLPGTIHLCWYTGTLVLFKGDMFGFVEAFGNARKTMLLSSRKKCKTESLICQL